MRLMLKEKVLLDLGKGAKNAHQLALAAQVSYPVVDRYVNKSRRLNSIDLTSLCALLVRGLGIDPKDVLEMQLGDLFEIVDE